MSRACYADTVSHLGCRAAARGQQTQDGPQKKFAGVAEAALGWWHCPPGRSPPPLRSRRGTRSPHPRPLGSPCLFIHTVLIALAVARHDMTFFRHLCRDIGSPGLPHMTAQRWNLRYNQKTRNWYSRFVKLTEAFTPFSAVASACHSRGCLRSETKHGRCRATSMSNWRILSESSVHSKQMHT